MFGLSFLSPAFLIGALAATVPVVLHLIGRTPRMRVPFPAVRLLKRAPAEATRRRHLRELLLLALRVGAVVLLALAFARPYFMAAPAGGAPRTLVVALDRSFSMSAPGQFARAKAAVRRVVAATSPGASVGLVAFDDDATIVTRPTFDRGVLLKALDTIEPGYGGTSYGNALARAAEVVGGAAGRIVVVTDLQRNGWDRRDLAIPARVEVAVEEVQGPTGNLSIGDLHRDQDGVGAIVRNSGAEHRSGRARLTIDGRLRGTAEFAVDGGGVQPVVFPGPTPATGEAVVEIDDGVGYPADNRAFALLDPPAGPMLLAVTSPDDARGSFYLERALDVDAGRMFRVETRPANTLTAESAPATLRDYAAIILLGTHGLQPSAGAALGKFVAAGGGLLVALDDQVDGDALAAVLGAPLSFSFEGVRPAPSVGFVAVDTRHPLLQGTGATGFAAVRFRRIARMPLADAQVLARFADGEAALVERQQGEGRILLFASDFSNRWNDLPLQPVFLPLVHEMARYLTHGRSAASDVVVAAVPAGVPHQSGFATTRPEGVAPGASPRRPAFRIAVNVDPRESNVDRMSAAEFQRAIARGGGVVAATTQDPQQAEQQQALWRLAAALALAALLLEGLVGKMAGAR